MIIFREMQEKDVDSVAIIEKNNFSLPWSEKSLLYEISNSNSIFLVAELDSKIIGYAGMYLIGDEGDITNIVIERQYRSMGYGRGLLNSLLEFAVNNLINSITLEVRTSNEAAISLYEETGFISEGIRPGFYDFPKEDAMIMWIRDINSLEK